MYRLWFETAMLAVESQQVIALRMMKLARGGENAAEEAHRMVAEKIEAAAEATNALAFGADANAIVKGYRLRVSANVRRLAS